MRVNFRQSVALLAAVASLWSCASIEQPLSADKQDKIAWLRSHALDKDSGHVFVVAHRACWRETAENSIAAIEACIQDGVDMVELDIRATRDGEIVLMHDETVDRTTNGRGRVEDLALTEFRSLKLKSGAGGEHAVLDPRDLSPPTLREALLAAKGEILVNIDAKAELYDEVFRIVDETGTGGQVLMKMRAAPDAPQLVNAAFLGRALFMPVIVQCDDSKEEARFCASGLDPLVDDYMAFNPIAFEIVYTQDEFLLSGVDAMRTRGRIWVNTLRPQFSAGRTDDRAVVNPDNVWGWLLDKGVSMIQTDYPIELLRYLETKGLRQDAPRHNHADIASSNRNAG